MYYIFFSVGCRIPLILDKSGRVIFLERSQSDDTFRPNAIIPGKETAKSTMVRTIVERLDSEAEGLQEVKVDIDDIEITIKIEYIPGGDGKAIQTCTGLLGAYCTACTTNKREGSDPNIAENGYPMNRSRDQNLALYDKLKKRDGTINMSKDSQTRLGMTQKPMGTFLDWTLGMPVLHDWIRTLYDLERLAMFMYARSAFPNDTPIMDGSGFPEEFKDGIESKLAEAKQFLRDQAHDGPLKMFLMVPNPYGGGGSRLKSSINKAPKRDSFLLNKTKLLHQAVWEICL